MRLWRLLRSWCCALKKNWCGHAFLECNVIINILQLHYLKKSRSDYEDHLKLLNGKITCKLGCLYSCCVIILLTNGWDIFILIEIFFSYHRKEATSGSNSISQILDAWLHLCFSSSLLGLKGRGNHLIQKSKQQYGRPVVILELCNCLLIFFRQSNYWKICQKINISSLEISICLLYLQ